MTSDTRYKLIYNRLYSLKKEQLQSIVDNIDLVCFDAFNFNEIDKTYCPLAIAHGLHETIENPTNISIQKQLSTFYSPVNILKGVNGEFYTTKRRLDLLNICNEILSLK